VCVCVCVCVCVSAYVCACVHACTQARNERTHAPTCFHASCTALLIFNPTLLLLFTCYSPAARARGPFGPTVPAPCPSAQRTCSCSGTRACRNLPTQFVTKKRKEMTTLAVTATASDSTAGISLEEAE